MKSLNTIRKIHKYKMESLIKEVSIMEIELISNQNSLSELIEIEKNEIENFSASDFSFTLENYISYLREEKQRHIDSIKRLENSIEQTRVMIHDEFSELKKIEHVIMINKKREKDKTEKAESMEMDENSTIRHNRIFL